MPPRLSLRCLTRSVLTRFGRTRTDWIERLEAEQLLQRDVEPARDAVEQQDHRVGFARHQPSIGQRGHADLAGKALAGLTATLFQGLERASYGLDGLASQPGLRDILLGWHSPPLCWPSAYSAGTASARAGGSVGVSEGPNRPRNLGSA